MHTKRLTSRARAGVAIAIIVIAPTAFAPCAAAQSCGYWDRPSLSPRTTPSMAFDSARNVAVMFGGNDSSYSGETWEYASATGQWTLRASTGPSPRIAAAMAYDAARGVTVLFGGSTATNVDNGETWEWDGV